MKTVRQHLANFHKAAAEHHAGIAEDHTKLGTYHEALAKCLGKAVSDDAGAKKHLEDIAATHHASAERNRNYAEFHTNAVEECMKGADVEDLSKLVPTNISAVVPSRAGVTMVPRYGQPVAKNVDPQFAELVATDDEL